MDSIIPSLLLGFIEWLTATAFIAAVTYFLWRPLRVKVAHVDVPVFLFVFIFLVTLTMLLLGLAGALYAMSIFIGSLLGIIAISWTALRRMDHAGFRRWAYSLWGSIAGWKMRHLLLAGFFLLLATLQVVRIGIHIWLLPPYSWDAMVYRLPKVAEWIQQHGLAIYDTPVQRTFWPANYELFETWFVLFPHHDFMIDAASIPFYLLAIVCVYSIVRSLELRPGIAAFAALIFAFTPSVALHAATPNNDLPIAAAYLMIVALLMNWRRQPSHLVTHLCLMFLAFCLALGTKAYIVFLLPGLLLIAAWVLWERRELIQLNTVSLRHLVSYVPLVSAGLVVGGYWYVRNYIVFGNPFYPTDFFLFGQLIFGTGEGLGQQGTFSLSGLLRSLRDLWEVKIYDLAGPYLPDVNAMTGWGWFMFSCAPPAIVYAFVRRPAARWLIAAFLLSLLSLLTWVTPDHYNMRFTLWFPALGAVCFAILIQHVQLKVFRRAFVLLASGCLLLNFAGTINVGLLERSHWQAMAHLPLTERSAAALQALGLRIGPTYQEVLKAVPPKETLGYTVPENGVIYPLYGADLSRRVRYVPTPQDGTIVNQMDRQDIKYLFAWRPRQNTKAAIATAVNSGLLQAVQKGLYVRKN